MSIVEDTFQKFVKIEENLNLFSKRIGGVFFWERVRFTIFGYLFRHRIGGKVSSFSGYSAKSKLKFYIKSIMNILKNPFFVGNREILFVGHQRRVLFEDKRWWDIYTDPILEELEVSHISIEPHFRLHHKTPTRTSKIRYFDFIDFIAEFKRKLGLTKINLTDEEEKLIDNIRKRIAEEYGVKLNIRKVILSSLEKRKGSLSMYFSLLRWISPKLVVLVVSYDKQDLIEACKRLDIPVVELQHGVINSLHAGYSFPHNKKTNHTFPDYVFVFGDYWKKTVKYPVDTERIIDVGFPYMEIEKRKYSGLQKRKQILILSQSATGKAMADFAIELDKLVKEEYKVIYKLHPREYENWRKNYPQLDNTDIQVIHTSEISLYRLFAESDVQVGVSSTAVFEGLAFGLRTYLLDLPGVEYFKDLIESNVARVVSSPMELKKELDNNSKVKHIDNEFFFRSNAVSNIIKWLQKLVHKNP